ncbi:MAG: RHS repeat-associated core domain-containing protein [Bacillales bacterium]|nr:RHS repeat-associated core domain-containing protein [Bacillales bacterium]
MWGKVTKTNVANTTAAGIIYTYNPYLYKGHYYDSEIELYYCNTRYYSPELCRWISIDAIDYLDPSTLENSNLYSYCNNNPVMGYDTEGNDAILITDYNFDSGLPVFGHAVLLIQDADGIWYITEFTGDKVSNARVYCRQMTDTDWARFENQTGSWWDTIKNLLGLQGCDKTYLTGDYTDSLALALAYSASQSYDKYNFYQTTVLIMFKLC